MEFRGNVMTRTGEMLKAIAVLCLAVAPLPSVAAELGKSLGADPAATCAGLAGVRVDAMQVDAAAMVEPTALSVAERGSTPLGRINPATPSFCRVLGHIDPTDPKAPPIRFQLNLPLQWNGRSLQYGGGGFNGVLITGVGLPPAAPFDGPSPLARGFATYGTDSGHETKPGQPPQAFAANDEAFLNFAHLAYKKVRDAAVTLITRPMAAGRSGCITPAAPRAGARR
jgi:Tannase and feruloyl esterase